MSYWISKKCSRKLVICCCISALNNLNLFANFVRSSWEVLSNLIAKSLTTSVLSKFSWIWLSPSWHSDVVTTLSQRHCWRCHNVVTWSKVRVVPTSVFDVVTKSLCDVIKTLLQRWCSLATTFRIGFLGRFTTDYSDFFPFIEAWES